MNIIRAWKDEEYRMSLSDEERSLLPDNPAGPMELSDADLESIVGGDGKSHGGSGLVCSVGCGGGNTGGVICVNTVFCSGH